MLQILTIKLIIVVTIYVVLVRGFAKAIPYGYVVDGRLLIVGSGRVVEVFKQISDGIAGGWTS